MLTQVLGAMTTVLLLSFSAAPVSAGALDDATRDPLVCVEGNDVRVAPHCTAFCISDPHSVTWMTGCAVGQILGMAECVMTGGANYAASLTPDGGSPQTMSCQATAFAVCVVKFHVHCEALPIALDVPLVDDILPSLP